MSVISTGIQGSTSKSKLGDVSPFQSFPVTRMKRGVSSRVDVFNIIDSDPDEYMVDAADD